MLAKARGPGTGEGMVTDSPQDSQVPTAGPSQDLWKDPRPMGRVAALQRVQRGVAAPFEPPRSRVRRGLPATNTTLLHCSAATFRAA